MQDKKKVTHLKLVFFDMNIIPEYKEGENIKYFSQAKEMYKTSKGYIISADVNGA